jgi:F-type H+-transporting ATPase subunit epsilon
MTLSADMTVTLRLPTRLLHQTQAVRLNAVAPNGSFGILPNHIDFVTALVPGVLTLGLTDGTEEIFGLDEGVLVKKGHQVDVVAMRGVRGHDLDSLHGTVAEHFLRMDEDERQARSAVSKLEATMVRRLAELRRPQI